ncbi:MAG: PHP domain-containing protein, partial [Clostridia bacterium]|nr:PHP domain-containing protein [Clostridia bacterium]
MAKTRAEKLNLLNAPEGLENLKALMASEPAPETGRDVNNHIHTTYSFSPYSPTAAVWFAREAGLCTCGLMDH